MFILTLHSVAHVIGDFMEINILAVTYVSLLNVTALVLSYLLSMSIGCITIFGHFFFTLLFRKMVMGTVGWECSI